MSLAARWSVVPLALVLAACGDDATSPDDTSGATTGQGGAGQGGSHATGTGGADVTTTGAGGDATSAGGAGGGTTFGPEPPPGSTLCGEGTFTSTEGAAICGSTVIGPPGNEIEQHCDAVSISAGAWEAWCAPTGVYLWAGFDDMVATGTYELCTGAPGMFINRGWYEAAVAGQGSGGDVVPRATYQIDEAPPTSVEIDLAIDDPDYAEEGSASIWLTPSLNLACPGNGFGPRFVAIGVSMTWDVTQ